MSQNIFYSIDYNDNKANNIFNSNNVFKRYNFFNISEKPSFLEFWKLVDYDNQKFDLYTKMMISYANLPRRSNGCDDNTKMYITQNPILIFGSSYKVFLSIVIFEFGDDNCLLSPANYIYLDNPDFADHYLNNGLDYKVNNDNNGYNCSKFKYPLYEFETCLYPDACSNSYGNMFLHVIDVGNDNEKENEITCVPLNKSEEIIEYIHKLKKDGNKMQPFNIEFATTFKNLTNKYYNYFNNGLIGLPTVILDIVLTYCCEINSINISL